MAETLCTWCGSAVDPEVDDHIQVDCSVEACGSRLYHVDCVREYLRSGRADKKACCNSQKLTGMKSKIENTPAEALKRRMCPVGQDKTSFINGFKSCNGMVVGTSAHDHKKFKKKAKTQPPPTVAVTKPKEKPKGSVHQAPKTHQKEAAKEAHSRRNLHTHLVHQSAAYNSFSLLYENGMRALTGPRRGRTVKTLLADNAQWSEEQMDFAINQGSLPPGFRTKLCLSINGEEPCRLGSQCQNAHSLAELRVDAAIDLGYLSPDCKTTFCQNFLQSGRCEDGKGCLQAHNLGELRILSAIKLGRLDKAFKTERCLAYDESHDCYQGELCSYAHGQSQLRAEAAIQLGKLSQHFKTTLCDMWCLEGRCEYGDQCFAAHGVTDMRIQAAINAKLVKDVYKTSACNRANCSRLHCHFFHDESDRLPMIGYKVQYCVAYKETGHCPSGKDCHFAHGASELISVDISSNFVTRAVEDEDTESMLSTETARSRDDKSSAFRQAKKNLHTRGIPYREHGRAGGAIVPLAVSSGRMPITAPKAAVKQKRRKGPEIRLCRKFEETGNCLDPNCRLAHGADDLKQRQSSARGESRASQPVFNAATAPAPRTFSAEALEAIRMFKLNVCIEQLVPMGFAFARAQKAALAAAGNVGFAIELLASGQAEDAGIPEMKPQAEIDDLCCVANSLNITTSEVEKTVMKHHGNHQEAMKELQAREMGSDPPESSPDVPDAVQRYSLSAPRAPVIATIPEAGKEEEEDIAAFERQMWASVKMPMWGPQDSSPFAPDTPQRPDAPEPSLKEQRDAHSLAEESAWQEYRAEDFCAHPAANQAAHQRDDHALEAAIQASRADAEFQEAFSAPFNGGMHHSSGTYTASTEIGSSNSTGVHSPLQHPEAHRAWFPPAHTFVGDTTPNGGSTDAGTVHKASCIAQEKVPDSTYSDVMAFLLG